MKKILVLLLVCALIFSLMISVTSCIPQTDNSGNNNNQGGGNNQGDNNQGDNNQDGDNTGDSTVEPGDSSINDKGSIDTPPIPVGSTDNRG